MVEPKIPTDPIVDMLNLVEEENNYLKEKIRKIEEEKMLLELHVADVVDDHKIKMDAMRLMIRKIRKYAIHTEAWYTSRKGGNDPGQVSPLVPVQSRTRTNGSI